MNNLKGLQINWWEYFITSEYLIVDYQSLSSGVYYLFHYRWVTLLFKQMSLSAV